VLLCLSHKPASLSNQIWENLLFLRFGIEGDLSRLQCGPLVSLDVVGECEENGEHAGRLDEDAFAVVPLGFGCPLQEGGDVLGQLTGSSWSSVGVLHGLVVEGLSHANGTAGEVWVVVLSLAQHDASWWVTVAGQEGEDVVLATVTGRHDPAEIWWVGAVVGSTRRFLVGVGAGEVVGELARSHVVLSSFIGSVLDHGFLS
jgi:hypothetical protein